MKKIQVIDGNEACANTAYMFSEVAGIYPITPSSTMAELVDDWSNKGRLNIFSDKVKVVEMQSEAGAAGLVHGSLQSGCLTSTFTASQGLLLMIPNMYKIAGEMLPCVMHVAARSLSTHALSIFGDHQDIYATRMTGFAQLASSSVQDASYLSGVAHLSAIKSSIPFMHFFDGFRTSHEIQKIDTLELEDYKKLIDMKAVSKFRKRALNTNSPYMIGTAQNDDIYFQATEARNVPYINLADVVNDYMQEINNLAGTDYKPFNYYGNESAKNIIIAMGSVCETIKETIDQLGDYGLIEVHLYRPFSIEYLKNVLPKTVENIAVLDRTKEIGSIGEPLYLDVLSALKNENINIVGGRYGLSSKNTTPSQIKAVFEMLNNPINNFTIGIVDDITFKSLDNSDLKIKLADEILIYGYGSDGMVSASKSIIKMIGNQTDKYVQGYFQYDSKKSGGVTISHLRFSDNLIKSTYYVENPKVVVVTKDSYLTKFDLLDNILENGTFIVNTIKTKEELISSLPENMKNIIVIRNINVYTINAYKAAVDVNLKNKISTIMQSAIMYLTNLISYDKAIEQMKKYAYIAYSKKGEQIVTCNYNAIDNAKEYLNKIEITGDYNYQKAKETDFFSMMESRRGDELKVSTFTSNPGIFQANTSRLEKRSVSDSVPCYLKENCIQCNQCSFVCPHAVIRPYYLTKEEYDNAPEYVKDNCSIPIEPNLKDYYFSIGVSVKDCTGCGLCIKTCPGKNKQKALVPANLDSEIKKEKQNVFDYLEKFIKNKNLSNKNFIKGSQFIEPKFSFSGACAGCGEAAYLKLLTQLFGDSLVVSNATGCSSIYGGSAPTSPYNVPWASSLFEDNAEYAFGMLSADKTLKMRLFSILENIDNELVKEYLNNPLDYDISKKLYDNVPLEAKDLKEYILPKSIWAIGGDGWAYDIGFSGIDHIIASNENINILVLDTQVYSNTGGQSSKATPSGAIAKFASTGKKINKKDLAKIALTYPNCYVAQVCLGANMQQVIKAFNEAAKHNGPSIIIAYSPCISHGIKGGMVNSLENAKLAVECGYFPIFRRTPYDKFTIDFKNVDFEKYSDFLNTQTRYSMLKNTNEEEANELLNLNKEYANQSFEYYKNLEK
ncbi:MAG: pyruvate:ferredoxin (flavodoxin) oxidoreductase [Mycoplasmatota bacterium]